MFGQPCPSMGNGITSSSSNSITTNTIITGYGSIYSKPAVACPTSITSSGNSLFSIGSVTQSAASQTHNQSENLSGTPQISTAHDTSTRSTNTATSECNINLVKPVLSFPVSDTSFGNSSVSLGSATQSATSLFGSQTHNQSDIVSTSPQISKGLITSSSTNTTTTSECSRNVSKPSYESRVTTTSSGASTSLVSFGTTFGVQRQQQQHSGIFSGNPGKPIGSGTNSRTTEAFTFVYNSDSHIPSFNFGTTSSVTFGTSLSGTPQQSGSLCKSLISNGVRTRRARTITGQRQVNATSTSKPSFCNPFTVCVPTNTGSSSSGQNTFGNPAEIKQPLFAVITSQPSSFGSNTQKQSRFCFGKKQVEATQPSILGNTPPASDKTTCSTGVGGLFGAHPTQSKTYPFQGFKFQSSSESRIQPGEKLETDERISEHSDLLSSKLEALFLEYIKELEGKLIKNITDSQMSGNLLLKMETLLERKFRNLEERLLANPTNFIQSSPSNFIAKMEVLSEVIFKKLDKRLTRNCNNGSPQLSESLINKLENLIEDNMKILGNKYHTIPSQQSRQLCDALISRLEVLFEEKYKKLERKCCRSSENSNQVFPDETLLKIEDLFQDNLKKLNVQQLPSQYHASQQLSDTIISKLEIMFENHLAKLEEKYCTQQLTNTGKAECLNHGLLHNDYQDLILQSPKDIPENNSSELTSAVVDTGSTTLNYELILDAFLAKVDSRFDDKIEELNEALSLSKRCSLQSLDQRLLDSHMSTLDVFLAIINDEIIAKNLLNSDHFTENFNQQVEVHDPNLVDNAGKEIPLPNDIVRQQSSTSILEDMASRMAEKDKIIDVENRLLILEKKHEQILRQVRKAEVKPKLEEQTELTGQPASLED